MKVFEIRIQILKKYSSTFTRILYNIAIIIHNYAVLYNNLLIWINKHKKIIG